MRLIVSFATPVPLFLCANPSHQRTEKLGYGLRHFGKFWPLSYKKFSLTGMPKVISLSLPSPFGSMTCSQVGPMSLGWPLAPSGGLVQFNHSLSQDDANGERPQKKLTLLLHICVGDVMLFNHQKCSETDWPEIHVSIFRMAAFGALLGIREGFLDLLLPHNTPGKGSTSTLHDLPRITSSFVFRKPLGRMNSCSEFRYWSHNSFVIANVHFEPDPDPDRPA